MPAMAPAIAEHIAPKRRSTRTFWLDLIRLIPKGRFERTLSLNTFLLVNELVMRRDRARIRKYLHLEV
jgi:hypothetical protein